MLFIGEAPGKVEDRLAKPFIGPSGRVLSTMIQHIGLRKYCIANVVCCIPYAHSDKTEIRPPSKQEAAKCQPHIDQLISLCRPKMVVLLGKEARTYFPHTYPAFRNIESLTLVHPAYILRRGGVQSYEYKQSLQALYNALRTNKLVAENNLLFDSYPDPKVVGLD